MIVSNYIQKYHQKEMTKYMSSLSVGIITIPNFLTHNVPNKNIHKYKYNLKNVQSRKVKKFINKTKMKTIKHKI